MSPRRSSRARTTQPPLGVATASSTSASSVSSARTDRPSRTNNKQSSPQKSTTPHSLSSEEVDQPSHDSHAEMPLTRRRTRELDHDDEGPTKLDDELDDDMAEEDEVTRCLCGYQEYPGDDSGGLFIQCDICKVWQHGGCVGIMEEATTPDEYFCEDCRKDLHKVMTTHKGQKYSRYLPVFEQQHGKSARKLSISKETDKPTNKDRDRNSRASVDSFSKRRSTMNSRAAYDDDEVLRKVLEESKHQGGPPSENSNRKKRSRGDSEETKTDIKRQRTSSRSPSNSPVLESEDDSAKIVAPKQKPRGAAARSQREKEQRERDRDKERAEAAVRRKGRAERRKGEDLEVNEPTPTPTEEPAMPPSTSDSVPPDTPTAEPKFIPAPRRGGRPPQKSRGRLGRNQYSRDTITVANGASPAHDCPNSPQAMVNGLSNGHDSSDGTSGTKPNKTKNWRLEKLSWNDIRRPAGVMQNYIAQRQVEMIGGKQSPAPAVQPAAMSNGIADQNSSKDEGDDLTSFKNLSTTQMMDHLSRDLVHWHQTILQQAEK